MIGRLDPANGEIKLVSSPTANSLPYGLLVNSKGAPFFAEFGSNKIGRVDPEDDADRGIRPAKRGSEASADCGDERRSHLVFGLPQGVPRQIGFKDRQGDRVAVSWRGRLRALRHHRD